MNEITPETLPGMRAKWLAAHKRGKAAAEQLDKLAGKIGASQAAVDKAIRDRQAVADVKAQLERDRRDGSASEVQLRFHAPAEFTQFFASIESRRKSLCTQKLSLATKIPRMLSPERVAEARLDLQRIAEELQSLDAHQSEVDRRIISEEMPALTDEERGLILTPEQRVAAKSAVGAVIAEHTREAAAFGTPEADEEGKAAAAAKEYAY